ncbi:hypothetical protein BB559_004545 [Furculomyces boomerangus]|uniref:Tryptophan--tRNA ligase n=2 Tax=Harpellales TaxID=61421 RepID=A0A2T9YE64_9FUNG|nr:hypothetical protein BB559_004545 [Furculomyces boomerangus]PWA02730.1 hypothetical protein BB558_001108 [Smittium angustum]
MKSTAIRIISGIQPTGIPHIGNYLGSIKNWVDLQDKYTKSSDSKADKNNLFFFIADLHALTIPRKAAELKKATLDITAMIIACGIDPSRSTLFKQSSVPAHSELMWMLSCITPIGWLNRMTQWRSKTQQDNENPEHTQSKSENPNPIDSGINTRAGLYTYPVLQAADILLYSLII